MIRKSDLSWRIGMLMLVLCAALVMTVLPAAADYIADKQLTEKYTGTVSGGMNYTIGNSTYSPKMWSNDDYVYTVELSGIPGLDVEDVCRGRLYVYWTWSFNDTNPSSSMYDSGVTEPEMDVNFNGTSSFDESDADKYWDCKNESEVGNETIGYNYPSGTYAFDVTDNLTGGPYVVQISNTYGPATYNQSFNIQAVGLLTLYNDGDSDVYHYWIDEGCDMTYVTWKDGAWKDGIAPSDAMSWANFSNQGSFTTDSATLITAVPAAGTIYNKLNFSGYEWYSLWTGSPAPLGGNFSWATTNVVSAFNTNANNYALICNGWNNTTTGTDGQMQAANAFLLVKESDD